MSRFGIEALTNGPGGEIYKSTLVIFRCDICGQLFDADFEASHTGVHDLRKAFNEALDESNGIVTVPAEVFDKITEDKIPAWVDEAEEGYSVDYLKSQNKNLEEAEGEDG